MNFDLIVIKLTKPHLKQVIAHHIAADPSISLQNALSRLDNLPLVYKKDLSFEELEKTTLQLQKLGAVCRAVESKNPLEKLTAGKKPVENEIKAGTEQKQGLQTSGVKYNEQAGKISERVKYFNTVSKTDTHKKKKSITVKSTILVGSIIIIAFIFLIGKNKKIKVQTPGPIVSKKSSAQSVKIKDSISKMQTGESEDKLNSNNVNKKSPSSSPVKMRSEEYADSAAHLCQDYECEIKFYKIAISFNQYNLRAWQGLIAAYRGARKFTEAKQAEKRMRELFGEKVFTVEEIVKPYGILSRYVRDKNGVCRIEYRSQSVGRPDLERETYFLIKALLVQQKCTIVSLYASTGKGKGMLVRIKPEKFPSGISDYVKKASISFIE